MSAELFFIFDTHCPWSMASTRLINEISTKLPDVNIHLWHTARYEGDETIDAAAVKAMTKDSGVEVSKQYIDQLSTQVDSTIAANLMAWLTTKQPHNALPVLNAMQQAHFQKGNSLQTRHDFQLIIDDFKLSPPAKVFNLDKLTKDAEYVLGDIQDIQEIIGTNAIPALLLANNDDLVLLNHNLYLNSPTAIVEAIKLELTPR